MLFFNTNGLKSLPCAGPPDMPGDNLSSHMQFSTTNIVAAGVMPSPSVSIPIGVEKTPSPPEKGKVNYFVLMMAVWLVLNGMVVFLLRNLSPESCAFGLSLGNLFTSIITRNEYFSCALMWSVVRITRREFLHRLAHNIGGIHAASGMCCTVWCVASIFSGLMTDKFTFLSPEFISRSTATFALLLTALSATKLFRKSHHNTFELIHRFLPWLLLGIFMYASVITKDGYHTKVALIALCTASILALITSTMTVTKVIASMSLVSEQNKKMAAIELPDIPYPGMGKIIKLSLDGREWHTFAVCPNIFGRKGSMCLMAAAGDWTSNLVSQCGINPTHTMFYTKKPIPSYMYSTRAFKSCVCIGTGAGIAPSLALFGQAQAHKVIWVNNMTQPVDPIVKYGSESGTGFKIFNTAEGRPSPHEIMAQIPSSVEAVFVMANPSFTLDIKNYCNERNIVCFGSNWDH